MREHDRNAHILLVASTTDNRIQTFTVGGGSLSKLKETVNDEDDDPTNDETVVIGIEHTLFVSLGMCVSPQEKLYSATGNGVIEQFRIRRSGELEYLSPSTAPLANGLGGIALSPDGRWLYATASPNKVRLYEVSDEGTLSPQATTDVDAGNQPVDVQITPDGLFAYVANLDDATISQYAIQEDGSLLPLPSPTITAPSGPRTMAIDSAGTHLYAACPASSQIAVYSIGSDGSLTHVSDADSALKGENVAVTSDMAFAFSGSMEGPAEIKRYSVGAGTLGVLSPAVSTQHPERRLAISPEGFLYVSYADESRVGVYRINADGTLALRDTESTVSDPGSIVFRYLP